MNDKLLSLTEITLPYSVGRCKYFYILYLIKIISQKNNFYFSLYFKNSLLNIHTCIYASRQIYKNTYFENTHVAPTV